MFSLEVIRLLKAAIEGAQTASSGRLFQMSKTRFEKKYFRSSQWTRSLVSFSVCPRVRLSFTWKKSFVLSGERPCRILYVSIRSKFNRLSSRLCSLRVASRVE